MTIFDLEREQLTVLPQRLETIILECAPLSTRSSAAQLASQTSNVEQANTNVQQGGACIASNCPQTNIQSNSANVNQQIQQVQRLRGDTAVIRWAGDRWLCGLAD